MNISEIAIILYNGFRPYVHHSKKEDYDNSFLSRKKYDSKFIKEFFPQYVNEKVWVSKPKEKRDTYLFNYFFVEVPTMGLVYTNLLKRYINDRHLKPLNSASKSR